MAGGLGFEPRLTESESAVLPLNYPPKDRSGRGRFLRRVAKLGVQAIAQHSGRRNCETPLLSAAGLRARRSIPFFVPKPPHPTTGTCLASTDSSPPALAPDDAHRRLRAS